MLSYGPGRENTKHRKDITLITFHIEAKPLELLWQPNIKATFYKLYSMNCEVLKDLVQRKYQGAVPVGPPCCCKAWAICCWEFPPTFTMQ